MKLSNDLDFTDDTIDYIGLPTQNYTDADLLDINETKLMVAGWGTAIKNITKEANIDPSSFDSNFFGNLTKYNELFTKIQPFWEKASDSINLQEIEVHYQKMEECKCKYMGMIISRPKLSKKCLLSFILGAAEM